MGRIFFFYRYILTGACLSRVEYAYTTDELGEPLNTVAYGYDDTLGWKDLLTSYGGQARSYDTIGNLISDGVWTYTWQGGRQLASMAKDGTSVSFAYDEKGLRLSKTVNDVVTRYTYSQGELIHVLDGSDVMRIRRDPNGQPMTIGFNGSEHFYLYNAQGDVVAIANYSGQVVVEYTYDAWGNPLSCTGSLASTLGRKNPFRYRGYVYDEETGLYYLKSRYYDPRVGRFICGDRIFDNHAGLLQTNLVSYCANNPVNTHDENGYSLLAILGVGLGVTVIGGLVGGIVNVMTGEKSWKNFFSGFVGSATSTAVAYTAVSLAPATIGFGILAGTIGGAIGNPLGYLASTLISHEKVSAGKLLERAVTGSITGAVWGSFPYQTSGLSIGEKIGGGAITSIHTEVVSGISGTSYDQISSRNTKTKSSSKDLSNDPTFNYYVSLNPLFYYSSFFRHNPTY